MDKRYINSNIDIIQKILKLDEKTISVVRAELVKRLEEGNKYSPLSALSITPWFIRAVSVFEKMLAPSMSKKFDSTGEDFVFVSCIDPVHRVKTLPLVAKDFKYTLFFLPSLTRPTVVRKYYKYYKESSTEKVYFGTFTWGDVKKYKKFVKHNAALINKIYCDNKNETQVLREYVRRFALYRIYAERVFARAQSDKLWLFEHDKFFFIPIINYFRAKGIMTTQLQHGVFLNPQNTTYIPLYSDKVICCSSREKGLYKATGIKDGDIYFVGAPLQAIGPKMQLDIEVKYDILVVLTVTVPRELELQKKVLMYIKDHLRDQKVLLRFRPRSAAIDKENLVGYTDSFAISNGTTLSEDLCSARKIITFSLDSVYEIIRNDKAFITFVDASDMTGLSLVGICHTLDEMENSINELLKAKAGGEQERYLSVFGEIDLEKIKDNFASVVSELKKVIV